MEAVYNLFVLLFVLLILLMYIPAILYNGLTSFYFFLSDYNCNFIEWFKFVKDKIKELFLKFTPLGYIIFGLIIIFFFLPSFLLSLAIIFFWFIVTRIIK